MIVLSAHQAHLMPHAIEGDVRADLAHADGIGHLQQWLICFLAAGWAFALTTESGAEHDAPVFGARAFGKLHGFFDEMIEIAQFIGQFVDFHQRFQCTADAVLEARTLRGAGIFGQFGNRKDEQQTLCVGLLAGGGEQVVKGLDQHDVLSKDKEDISLFHTHTGLRAAVR